MPYKFTDAVQY